MLWLVCALVLNPDTVKDGRVTVWQSAITIQELAQQLSAEGQPFSADAAVADRRAAVFAKDRPVAEIAAMAADGVGMRLQKVGSGWSFVADPRYEKVMRGHPEDVRTQTREALRLLILDLQKHPPTPVVKRIETDSVWTTQRSDYSYPVRPIADFARRREDQVERWRNQARSYGSPEVHWMFANANDSQVEQLLAGHAVMASLPGLNDGTIKLPGNPSDYAMLPKVDQLYVVVQLQPDTGRLRTRFYSRGQELRATASDPISVLPTGGSVYSYGEDWTALGDWVLKWKNHPVELDREALPRAYPQEERPFGTWLEEVAYRTQRPVVAIASPRRFNEDLGSLAAIREDGVWLQALPPLFWMAESDYAHLAKLIPEPNFDDPAAAIDTVLDYGVSDVYDPGRLVRNGSRAARIQTRYGAVFQYDEDFKSLWRSLSATEKRAVVTTGLPRARLAKDAQLKFDDALYASTIFGVPKGEAVDLVAPAMRQKAILRIVPQRRGLLATETGSGTFDLQRAEQAIRQNSDSVPFETLELDLTFETGAASVTRDFQIVRTYRPGGTGG